VPDVLFIVDDEYSGGCFHVDHGCREGGGAYAVAVRLRRGESMIGESVSIREQSVRRFETVFG
jgi:hypothetical protein